MDWYPDLEAALRLCEAAIGELSGDPAKVKQLLLELYDALSNIEGKSHYGLAPDGY